MRNLILIVTIFILLVGCTAEKQGSEEILPITVELVTEENINQNIIQVKVKQGENAVDDATEVIFEYWQEQTVAHKQIIATHMNEGIYEGTFQNLNVGEYHLIVHTTARGLHVMPEFTFLVTDY